MGDLKESPNDRKEREIVEQQTSAMFAINKKRRVIIDLLTIDYRLIRRFFP
jgi:hypothetical protein